MNKLRNIIETELKKVNEEGFEWAVDNTVSFLEVGEPLSVQSPKNVYRLHVTHGVGEENGTWVPNWNNYDPTTDLDLLVRHVKILNWLSNNYKEGLGGLCELWVEGETWILSDQDNQYMKSNLGEYDEGTGMWILNGKDDFVEEVKDIEEVKELVRELLDDELTGYGIREYNSYYHEEASIEDWAVTYFDEFGIEHSVKVNLPQS